MSSPVPWCLFVMKNLCSEERKINGYFRSTVSTSLHMCARTHMPLIHNVQPPVPKSLIPLCHGRVLVPQQSWIVLDSWETFFEDKTLQVWALNSVKIAVIYRASLSRVWVQSGSKNFAPNIKQHHIENYMSYCQTGYCSDTIKSFSSPSFSEPLGMKRYLDFYLLLP